MSLPIVSVVIPTYNQANFLREALQSVLSQSLTNLEVIVVNNFSDDHTQDVVLNINDPRVRLINFKNQGRIASSRNVGIKEAKGEWLAFLDSDDLWVENKLEESLLALKQGYDLLAHGQIFFDQDTKTEKKVFFGPSSNAQYLNMLFGVNPISTSTVVMKTSWAKKLGGFQEDDRYITSEDYDFWLRLANSGAKILILDKILGKHRKHSASSSSSLIKHISAQKEVVYDHYKLLPKSVLNKMRLKQKEAILEYAQARTYHEQGNANVALKHYVKAWLHNPFFWKIYVAPWIDPH